MNTYTRKTKKRLLAQLAANNAANGVASSAMLTLQMQLRKHQQDLKDIQAITDKAIHKASFLPEFAGHIDGILSAGAIPVDDSVFSVLMLYTIDAGDLNRAAEMAALMLKTPNAVIHIDGFQRTAVAAIYEQMAEQITAKCPIDDQHLQMLLQAAQEKQANDTHPYDMPDPVRAKFFKAVGERYESAEKPVETLQMYELAYAYDKNSGVKSKINQLQKQLNA